MFCFRTEERGPLSRAADKCHGSSCRKERTNSTLRFLRSLQKSVLLIGTNTWACFPIFPIHLPPQKHLEGLRPLSQARDASAPLLVYYQRPPASPCSWKGKYSRDGRDGNVSTPPRGQEGGAPPRHCAAGTPGDAGL